MPYRSIVLGTFQLVEYPEKGLMVLNEIFVDAKSEKTRRFCFLKEDMVDIDKSLKENQN